jgi:hypothetical protein
MRKLLKYHRHPAVFLTEPLIFLLPSHQARIGHDLAIGHAHLVDSQISRGVQLASDALSLPLIPGQQVRWATVMAAVVAMALQQ